MIDIKNNLIYENEISEEQLNSQFNGVNKWILYWFLMHILYIICYDTFGLFLALSTVYFFICCILLTSSFKNKNYFLYKKAYVFTLIYSLTIIIYDFVIMLIIFSDQDFFRKKIAPALLIDFPEHIVDDEREIDNQLDINVLVLGITIIFIVVIITQIIFIQSLYNRIKFFELYQHYIWRISGNQQYNPQDNNIQDNSLNNNVATSANYMSYNSSI
jgi:hypothetical protein